MRKNNSQNPRKSSNRGHHSKKNSTEFNQEQENHIFAQILGMPEYCNMGIISGFFDCILPSKKKSTKKQKSSKNKKKQEKGDIHKI